MSTLQQPGYKDPLNFFEWIMIALIIILILTCVTKGNCQGYSNLDSVKLLNKSEVILSGSCASPDGNELEIGGIPPNWTWLYNNGYCYTGAPLPTRTPTMCFTMVSPGTDIFFNMGYSVWNCSSLALNYAYLYTSGSCVLIDNTAIGTTTGLVSGQSYTWCISLIGYWDACLFTSLCPYYINVTPLSVVLIAFECSPYGDRLYWFTEDEIGTVGYTIEGSNDAKTWHYSGTLGTNSEGIYQFDITNLPWVYYRLIEDTETENSVISGIIHCGENLNDFKAYYELYDLSGHLISKSTGLFITESLIASHGAYFVHQYINGKSYYKKLIK